MIKQRLLSLATGATATRGAVFIACALLLAGMAAAQNSPNPGQNDSDDDQAPVPVKVAPVQPPPPPAKPGPTITIRILDSKTGEPVNPTNLLVRVDRREEPYNEGLKLNGIDPATATLPPSATLLSVEGAYNSSTEVYVNCDGDSSKTGALLRWYSIADILKTGMVTPNLCFKGKYQLKFNITPKPGEFVFFVRAHGWREALAD